MAENLSFRPDRDGWYTTLTSQGLGVVEIAREKQGIVSVSAGLDGMALVPVMQVENPYIPNVIFELDIPQGVEVKIYSATEPTEAKVLWSV